MNNVDLGIWGKLTRGMIFLLLLAGVLLVFLSYLPLIRQNERYRQQIQLLDAQIQKVDAANRQLQSEINALRNDPQAIDFWPVKNWATPGPMKPSFALRNLPPTAPHGTDGAYTVMISRSLWERCTSILAM